MVGGNHGNHVEIVWDALSLFAFHSQSLVKFCGHSVIETIITSCHPSLMASPVLEIRDTYSV